MQIPIILFCFTILSIFLFFLLFERLGQWIPQAARDNRKIPTDTQSVMRGTIHVYIFHKILLPFPAGVENTYNQLSRKLFNLFENCLRIVIEVLEFYKKCAAWTEVAAQLSPRFAGGMCVICGITENVEYLRHHSTDFHQVLTGMLSICLQI